MRSDGRSGDGPLEAWVWRIVLNAARFECAGGSRGRVRRAAAGNGRPERRCRGARGVAACPITSVTAVFLRYYADLDYAAIAAALGIHSETVAATLNSAHTTLRTRLEEVRT